MKENYASEITRIKNRIKAAEENRLLLEKNADLLIKTADLLQKQLKDKQDQLNTYISKRQKAAIKGDKGTVSVLLIDSGIQKQQQLVDNLEERLVITLGRERSELEISITENKLFQNNLEIELAQVKMRMLNMTNTRTIVPIVRSAEPVGVRRSLIVIFSA